MSETAVAEGVAGVGHATQAAELTAHLRRVERFDWCDADNAMAYLGVSKAGLLRMMEHGHVTRFGPTSSPQWRWRCARFRSEQLRAIRYTEPTWQPGRELEWPAEPPPAHHLYAVEIFGVGTKIGITSHPTKRLATHERTARQHRRKTGRLWVSVKHIEATRNEERLRHSQRNNSEYLRAPFDKVMELIEALPMSPP